MKVWFRPLLLVMLLWPAVACAEEVDLELVLAMDGSGSINPAEYELQINGTIAAFYDPGVQQAILSGPTGKIAVAVLIWSDAAFPKITTGWYLLDSQRSIEGFARTVRDFHQHTGRKFGIGGGGTGIGDGVVYALGMIAGNDFDGLRRVIDVSGDGVETDPWFAEALTMPFAKRLAEEQGVTVNGLAILTDFPTLGIWYRNHVITGVGSFVITARNFSDFAVAIRQKLLRETAFSVSEAVPEAAPQVRIASDRNTPDARDQGARYARRRAAFTKGSFL
ncbi:MAG: DUF1194 domain-containing protein [Albidovulum sp.]